ncbi:MAG: GNAT family N-acetyltransferase [Clostridiales bacterium]|jgi:transcriptional regulator with XRE-family HTH domain|nr:GNAT family N-acetyltransferase [Clostridiales bacterium]
MDIGTTIKKLRLKNGITQQQLADRLNVSMQTISRWETSVTYPDVVMLPILARYFRVSVDYLLNVGGNVMKTIESGRLLVREWNENDAADFLEIKRKSHNFIYYVKINTMDDALDCIKIWKEYQEMYPLILKQTNKLIGIVGLVDVNRYKGYKELEVHLCDDYNNEDYATEAHKLILGYGFSESGLLVAFTLCGCDEEILKQALINTGFVFEGTLRKFGRDMSDRMRYSITKDEYHS